MASRLGGTGIASPHERLLIVILNLHKRSTQVVISLGDFSRGLKLLKSSASLDPECPIPYVNAARAYLGMNDLVAARRQVLFFTGHIVCTGTGPLECAVTGHLVCTVVPLRSLRAQYRLFSGENLLRISSQGVCYLGAIWCAVQQAIAVQRWIYSAE